MSLSNAMLAVAEFILALIALVTFLDYMRHRDDQRLDIALMFATLGAPALLILVDIFFPQDNEWNGFITTAFLLAHPYMMLRLVRHFGPLATWASRAALGGLIFSLASLIGGTLFINESNGDSIFVALLVLSVLLAFVLVEGYAAFSFARGAAQGTGIKRHRLQFLAAGSGFLATFFFLILVVILLQPYVTETLDSIFAVIFSLLAIIIAVNYFLGLTPPARLRRYWQFTELQAFLDQMDRLSFDYPSQHLLNILSEASVQAVGGCAGATVFWQPETNDFLFKSPKQYAAFEGFQIPDSGQIGRSWHDQIAILPGAANFSPGDRQAAAQVDAQTFAAIPIQVMDKPLCLLLVFLAYNPLFPGDDLALLKLFASRVSLALAFAPLLEQERKLVKQLKEKTAELQEAHDTLEHRVEERTADLAAINQEIQDFTYIVSHDLRSPLVNLKGFITELGMSINEVNDLLDKVLPHLDEADQRKLQIILRGDVPESMDFINTAAVRMDSLVRALLDLSRIGRRPLEFGAVDMNVLVSDTLKTLAHVIEEKGVTVVVDPLPEAYSDLLSIEQIMSNLLTNAVNYLDPERPGYVKISATQNHDTLIYHIQDNGRGIAAADCQKVFAPFRRVGKQDVPGEGMGLAYVQTLVRRHNGRITFESEPGVGTTFNLIMPKSRSSEAPNNDKSAVMG